MVLIHYVYIIRIRWTWYNRWSSSYVQQRQPIIQNDLKKDAHVATRFALCASFCFHFMPQHHA